jgi:hypothetical protein
MECLKNYIGIYGCSEVEPESGLFINQLPSVSLATMDGLANSEQLTYLKVWDDVQVRALRRFKTMVTAYFKSKYRLLQLVDRLKFGVRTTASDLGTLSFRGVAVELNPAYSDKQVSSLLTVAFDKIEFFSTVTATLRFVIVDLDKIGSDTLLWEKNIAVTANEWNTVLHHWSAPALDVPNRLGLSVEWTFLTDPTVKTTIPDGSGSDGCGCGCGCISLSGCCSADIKGFVFDTGTATYTSTPDNAHGFRGYASLKCGYESLVCVNKDLFANAIWYLMGQELMVERMHSSRINNYTTLDRTKAAELHDLFGDQAKTELTLAVDGIDLQDGDCCLECDPIVAQRTLLP